MERGSHHGEEDTDVWLEILETLLAPGGQSAAVPDPSGLSKQAWRKNEGNVTHSTNKKRKKKRRKDLVCESWAIISTQDDT